jgi:hypothetical protein
MAAYDPNKLSAYKGAFGTTYVPPTTPVAGDTAYTDKYGQSWDSGTQGQAFESWMDTNKFDAGATAPVVTAPTAGAADEVDNWWVAPDTTEAEGSTGLIGTPSLVSTGINDLIKNDSPLMQRAAVRADQQSNKRGLMNSSMAVQAGQAALYDAAAPIAQADADAKNTLLAQSNTIRQQQALANTDAENKLVLQDIDNQFKAAVATADIASKQMLQTMSDDTKTKLAGIEADYKTLIQTSASASDIYRGALGSISEILRSTTMDATTKATNINNIYGGMSAAMNLVGSINGVALSGTDPATGLEWDLLDFGEAEETVVP